MKRFFSTLLACALTLALALSFIPHAFAQDEPGPAMPVITVQPQGSSQKVARATFTLSVEAHIPSGDAIGYEWYRDGVPAPINATGASMSLGLTTPRTANIYVVVHNLDHPEYSVTSQTVQIELQALPFWDKVRVALGEFWNSAGNSAGKFLGGLLQLPLKIIAYPFVALIELLMLAAIVVLPLLSVPFLWISNLFRK